MASIGQAAVLLILLTAVYMGLDSADTTQSQWALDISCEPGWLKAMNNCYAFNTGPLVTWDEARTECSLLDSDLMIVANREEMVYTSDQTEAYKTDGWWVGLRYMRGSWQWVQYGGDTTLINWRNEPDNYDGYQNCMAINEFGLFSDEYCSSQLGFICQYPVQTGKVCKFWNKSGWLQTSTSCYYMSQLVNASQHLSWSDAKQYCAGLVPGQHPQLMSLTNVNDMLELQKQLDTYDTAGVLLPWWTGMNDLNNGSNFVWQDGTPINYNLIQWEVAPSLDRSKGRNCGVMYQGGVIDDMKCDKRAHYVCETSAIREHLKLGCGTWLRAGTSCYLFANGKLVSWTAAKDTCVRANAHLLKVDSMDERMWLESQLLLSTGYWSGLTDKHYVNQWRWADGSLSNTSLINWGVEPNNYDGNEGCVEVYMDGAYNDRECIQKRAFICEYSITPGVPCVPGWISRDASCYYFSPANQSYWLTWYEVKQKCSDLVISYGLVAYRLAVNDKTEQTWMNAQLSKLPVYSPGYWTGLNDLKMKGIWQFDDDFNNPPNMDVIPWAKYPNNFDGKEDCAIIIPGGEYIDLNCDTKAFFICEKDINSAGVTLVFSVTMTTIAVAVSMLL